jgi:hypothetical protein
MERQIFVQLGDHRRGKFQKGGRQSAGGRNVPATCADSRVACPVRRCTGRGLRRPAHTPAFRFQSSRQPMTSTRGRFITFEGIDGAGKSTLIGWVVDRIVAAGHRAVATREPGGTPLGEALRELLLHEPMAHESEAPVRRAPGTSRR